MKHPILIVSLVAGLAAHEAAAKDLGEAKVNEKVCRALWKARNGRANTSTVPIS